MRLLLDEMHSPAVAVELRRLGLDVVVVKEVAELIGFPDAELLRAATSDRRAVVTENIKDFAALHKTIAAAGQRHSGLVFTHAGRFPRWAGDHVPTLIDALGQFLAEQGGALDDVESLVWWLERAQR
ncbi:DUF5615 family PIN-like protein [Candidatus Poriferisodalis sp.]|uniref:DUF5615 family PIN-like protein n=1 Tax=Candidatus Poriferisodalis sp. TaxID=3101277 RepID=UPI003C6F7FDF